MTTSGRPCRCIVDKVFSFLRGKSFDVYFGSVFRACYGMAYCLISNPTVPTIAQAQSSEATGILILVSSHFQPPITHPIADALKQHYGDTLVTPLEENRWKAVNTVIRRARRQQPTVTSLAILFALHIPEVAKHWLPEKQDTLLELIRKTGLLYFRTLCLTIIMQSEAKEIPFRPLEWIWIGKDTNRLIMILIEQFASLEQRVHAAWVCKRVSLHKQAQRTKWNVRLSLTPPKYLSHVDKTSRIWMTWEFAQPFPTRNTLAAIAVDFRPFLIRALRQVRFVAHRDAMNSVAKLLGEV